VVGRPAGDLPYFRVALVGGDVAQVGGEDAVGVLLDRRQVGLRVALTAVADEEEVEVGVGGEDRLDPLELVLLLPLLEQVLLLEPEVLEEDRTGRDVVEVEVVVEQPVVVPRARRDVEDRVRGPAGGATLERPVEGGDAEERPACGSRGRARCVAARRARA